MQTAVGGGAITADSVSYAVTEDTYLFTYLHWEPDTHGNVTCRIQMLLSISLSFFFHI